AAEDVGTVPAQVRAEFEIVSSAIPGHVVKILVHLVDFEIRHGARLAQPLVGEAAGQSKQRKPKQAAINRQSADAVFRGEIADRFIRQLALIDHLPHEAVAEFVDHVRTQDARVGKGYALGWVGVDGAVVVLAATGRLREYGVAQALEPGDAHAPEDTVLIRYVVINASVHVVAVDAPGRITDEVV